jgi:AmmeMemoRadiSam system protein B
MQKYFWAVLFLITAMAVFIFLFPSKKPHGPAVEHYSYFSQAEFFEEAYAMAGNSQGEPVFKGVIVNHHLLAKALIAETFNRIATTAPITVVLISPNHFATGKFPIITSSAVWKTPFGDLQPDAELIKNLSQKNQIYIEEAPFEQEHGVSGIVGFIKKSLPNAKLVPLIVKDRLSLTSAKIIANQLHQILPNKKYMVVGSFDFSHYLTSRASDFHDAQSLAVLENLDFNKLKTLDVDSRPGLAVFLELMRLASAQKFTLFKQSNSAKLVRQDILESTSYLTGGFSVGENKPQSIDTLLSLGNLAGNNSKLSWEFVNRLFWGQDYTLSFVTDPTAKVFFKREIEGISESIIYKQLGNNRIALVNGQKVSADVLYQVVKHGVSMVICQGAKENKVEIYKNVPIIFATGNLVDSPSFASNTTSLAVGVVSKAGKLEVYLLPMGVKAGAIKLLIGTESDKVLKEMANNSSVPKDIKIMIQKGIINF